MILDNGTTQNCLLPQAPSWGTCVRARSGGEGRWRARPQACIPGTACLGLCPHGCVLWAGYSASLSQSTQRSEHLPYEPVWTHVLGDNQCTWALSRDRSYFSETQWPGCGSCGRGAPGVR